LADSDIDDIPGRTTRADPKSSAAPPNKSSSASNQQETTMEPKKLAEIFVRRVIKPKIDTNIPAKIGNFTSAASPATTETQPLVATSASSTEVLPVNKNQKRSIPGNLRRPGLNKGSMSNQQTSVGLYLPKYN
jgi:hypothetical protein